MSSNRWFIMCCENDAGETFYGPYDSKHEAKVVAVNMREYLRYTSVYVVCDPTELKGEHFCRPDFVSKIVS